MIDDNKFKVKTVEINEDGTYGKFVCEPLDRGYGITLGNSLRRVLLASLDGVAITSIKIDGVLHEFSTIPGVREDVSEIILNLKQVRMKFLDDDIDALDITVDISGECEFTANDLNVNSDIEILNPDLHIATLDTDANIRMQCHIERGKGYVPSTKNKKETDMIGVIPIDSIFSPIVRTNYEVGNIRVGNEMDYDSLTLEVTTDGSITAENAVAKAASIMISYLNYFQDIATDAKVNDTLAEFTNKDGEEPEVPEEPDLNDIKIDVLDLSVRASNCLKRANIYTLGDLVERTEDDLSKIRNLGKKSVDEIIEKLQKEGYDLAYRKLGRDSSARKALLRSIVTSLFQHERIETTEAKAKELRKVADKMLTLAKRGDLHARRQVLAYMMDEDVVKKLFDEIAPKYKDRQGGYTRIIKTGVRQGDAAPMVIIELV